MGLKVERMKDNAGVSISFRGAIDESSDLEAVFKGLSGPVTLNLRGVERVTSLGVSHWMMAVGNYAKKNKVIITEITYAMTAQACRISNMLKGAEVISCYAPYFCDKCGETRAMLITKAEHAAAAPDAPERRCKTCGEPMTFDDIDSCFDFFKD